MHLKREFESEIWNIHPENFPSDLAAIITLSLLLPCISIRSWAKWFDSIVLL